VCTACLAREVRDLSLSRTSLEILVNSAECEGLRGKLAGHWGGKLVGYPEGKEGPFFSL